jgi:type IV secretory pathway VirD2 relaxase
MSRKDDERPVRLRPRKPTVARGRNEGTAWAIGYKLLMHYARMSRKSSRGRTGPHQTPRPYLQRCAVRITYTKNTTRGVWKAHGRYIARESAIAEGKPNSAGFDSKGPGIDVAGRLQNWQAAKDELLWKLILSPEFGERADLPRFTRDLMKRIAEDLGEDLEWVAVAHYNTEHPHVHVAVRGVSRDGQPLRLRRDYVRQGVRRIAEDLCTHQLGYRTMLDAAEADRREINEKRFTSLDRMILRDAQRTPAEDAFSFTIVKNPMRTDLGNLARLKEQHLAARLAVLERMGLAESSGPNTSKVRRDFETVLRAMQQATDRQKTLAQHGILMSDERLPVEVLDWRQRTLVRGRVLVHGQDEHSGRSYLLLEGTDAKVHFMPYTPEMEEARSQGGLRTNSFITMRKLFVAGQPLIEIEELGHSETVLTNGRLLRGIGQLLLKNGNVPNEDGWGGWLGRYQKALCAAFVGVEQQQRDRELRHVNERHRDRSHGR